MKFTVPGDPKPKGRPRTRVVKPKSGAKEFAQTYTPAATRSFEAKVADCAKLAGVRPVVSGPMYLDIAFFLHRPGRLIGKKHPLGPVPCDRRPDADNLAKAITDGLNGVAFKDDSQVSMMLVQKFYHEQGGVSRTEVVVKPFA